MKKTFANFGLSIAAMALLTAGIVTGCDKKEEDKVADAGLTAKRTALNAKASDYVREDELEDWLLKACTLADPDKEYVSVKQVPDLPGMYDIAILSLEYNPLPGGQPQPQARAECSGPLSMSLVRCMQKYIMAHGCGMVYYNAGTWTLYGCG